MLEHCDLHYYLSIVEDKPENAELGLRMGLKSVLVNQLHNADFENDMIPRVENWEQIRRLILSD